MTRVAGDVGKEGKLGAQADVRDVSGTLKDLTDMVNMLAGKLTDQVATSRSSRRRSRMATSQKITVEKRRARSSSSKKTPSTGWSIGCRRSRRRSRRRARKSEPKGVLGAEPRSRTHRHVEDLTENVNVMASNLTNQVRGKASRHRGRRWRSLRSASSSKPKARSRRVADTINSMTASARTFAREVTRVAGEVGTEGRSAARRACRASPEPGRADRERQPDGLESHDQVRGIAKVVTAVADGDLGQRLVARERGRSRRCPTQSTT